MLIFWSWLFFVVEWAIRLVMLLWVPQKRSPAAARTWLLLILIEPILGVILYAILGRAYLSRRRIELLQRVEQVIKARGRAFDAGHARRPDLPAPLLLAVRLAENLGDFTILGGNRVELLPGYEESIERLLTDINAAKRHVHLLYYIFADDATGQRVTNALVEAVRRGVTCRVLLDGFGSRSSLRTLAPRLRDAGVEVIEVLPMLWWRFFRLRGARFDLRNHRKIAVIDGRIGYVGSQNLVDATFKPGIIYEELVARVTGPVVLQLQAVLLGDRYFETEEVLEDPSLLPAPELTGEVAAQTLPSGPGYPHENNQRIIVALVHAAQKRVVITTPYFIPDEPLLQALTTAVLRGVEVHLIVSRKPDQILVGLAQRSYYEGLLEVGVQIHLYKAGFLHAKHLSIDDAVVVLGSTNMDIRSFSLLAEISLIVYDAGVAEALRAVQQRYLLGSDLLTLEEWQRRSFRARLLENMARLFDALL